MQKCTKCGIEKQNESFSRGNNKFGLSYWCKECCRIYLKNRYVPKQLKGRNVKLLKEHNKRHQLKQKLIGATRARHIVRKLVKKGKLMNLKNNIIKCTDCNSRATEYDHRDYNYPERVDPVCKKCNMVRGSAIPITKISD